MAKNLIFWYKIAYKKKLGFFFEKRALSLFCLYHSLTSCKELERSLEPFLRKSIHQLLLRGRSYIGPLPYGGPKFKVTQFA